MHAGGRRNIARLMESLPLPDCLGQILCFVSRKIQGMISGDLTKYRNIPRQYRQLMLCCFDQRQTKTFANLQGNSVGPDDVYLTLRGLRTLGVRLRRHRENGLKIARWLRTRPEVERVIHPALPEHPGHALWQRDFTGACGLFGFTLKTQNREALEAMLNHLRYFGMGYSWGGFESLLIPTHPEKTRTATQWRPAGHTLRIHVGLEDPEDLIADLEAGFRRLNDA